MSFILVVDTTCDLTIERAKELGIVMIPLTVNFKDGSYQDKYEISNEEFFKKLTSSKDLPTTSLVSPAAFEDLFNKYPNDDIMVLTIATKLSGTNNSASIAKEICGRENISIIDSKNTTFGLALLAKMAVELRDKGTSLNDATAKITELADKLRIAAVIDVLDYLVKGGRLSKTSGVVGSVLGVKPIITVEDGEVKSIGKARGFAKATEAVCEKFKAEYDSSLPVMFGHSIAPNEAKALQKLCGIKDAEIGSVGSVVGTHAGPGCCGVAYFIKQ